MAAYSELYALSENRALFEKVCSAVAVACDDIRTEDPSTPDHDMRVLWAKRAIVNVDGVARSMMWALLAQYSDQATSVIEGATDAQIQTAVNNTVDLLS